MRPPKTSAWPCHAPCARPAPPSTKRARGGLRGRGGAVGGRTGAAPTPWRGSSAGTGDPAFWRHLQPAPSILLGVALNGPGAGCTPGPWPRAKRGGGRGWVRVSRGSLGPIKTAGRHRTPAPFSRRQQSNYQGHLSGLFAFQGLLSTPILSGATAPARDGRLGQVRRPLRLRGESVRLHGPAAAGGPVELPAERGAVERPPGERGLLPYREPLRGVRDGRQGAAADVGRRDQPGHRGQSWPPTCQRAGRCNKAKAPGTRIPFRGKSPSSGDTGL